MKIIFGMVFMVFTLGGGGALVYGTWRNWSLLVDPPQELALLYSLSFVKKTFGAAALRFHNYLLGVVFILVGLFTLWNEFFGTARPPVK